MFGDLLSVIVASLVLAVGAFFWHLRNVYWDVLNRLFRLLVLMKVHSFFRGKGAWSFVDLFESKVDLNPNRVQFTTVENGLDFTLMDVEKLANQIAHWGLNAGCKQMDTVAIMLLNHPDFVSLWLGFGKIGVGSALLNTNIGGKALIHSCDVALKDSEVKILIVDSDLRDQIVNDLDDLASKGIRVVFWNSQNTVASVKSEVILQSTNRVSKTHRNQIKERDPLLYIFTSGTTGMPKACKISQTRFYMAGLPFAVACGFTPKDNIYAVLPLYHSAVGMICVSSAIYTGARVILRRKFSASKFTEDCLKYKVTAFQYIGELCRYLVAAPVNEKDKLISIRVAYGNGLRPEIWTQFTSRYNVNNVVEFYGATEGNAFLMNPVGKVGALGYLPRQLDRIYPAILVRFDPENPDQPFRNAQGFAVKCGVNEPGLFCCRIQLSNSAERRFEGYTDKKATESKILRGLFEHNDSYFNTGDVLSRDSEGFYYWCDRTGDTFRWKGENVATTEVAAAITGCKGVQDIAVYGVSVPNCDGKAGMAVIVTTDKIAVEDKMAAVPLDLSLMRATCKLNLPNYSWPLFLRIRCRPGEVLKTTSTFKHIHTDLMKEGFDPTRVGNDLLYYFNNKSSSYEVLSVQVYEAIQSGQLRF